MPLDDEDMAEIFDGRGRLCFEEFAGVCFGGKLTQVEAGGA
jgi:hypothetical protein